MTSRRQEATWTRRLFTLCVASLWAMMWAMQVADADPTVGVSRGARGGLKLLYWATDGRLWKNGWDIQNEMSDPCLQRWYGITCDDDFHIVAIRLASNNLVGYLPVEFPRASMGHLQVLDLSSNFLSGPVPATISLFTELRVLRLDRNSLNGALPPSIGSLAFLEYLEVQANLFGVGTNGRIVPDEVAALSQTTQCHIVA